MVQRLRLEQGRTSSFLLFLNFIMFTVVNHTDQEKENASMAVHRFQNGDEKAFATIYDHFYQRVYFFALRFVQEPDARDVTSEAFIKLWNKREDFDDLEAIGSFLFVLVRNRCFDMLRHEVVKNEKQPELIRLLESSNENDLFLEQVRAELIRLIYREVEKLPARMKEVFLLSFAEGLKPAEIATRLQISTQTVSNQKLTAIKLLKAALGNHASILLLLVLLHAAE